MSDYLDINRANWDARADVHVGPGGYGLDEIADPGWLSDVVQFDRPLLGDLAGVEGVHLQCHLGTDTLSLARLGATMTGLDLSPRSLEHARAIAERAGVAIEYVESDVYGAVDALGAGRFDLAYTGIGALCWLPDIARWARTVAALLRPGGRLFVRDAHPVLLAVLPVTVGEVQPDSDQQPWLTGVGGLTPALELPYWEEVEPVVWADEVSYAGTGSVASPTAMEWNHALSEIVMAVLDAGLRLELLREHDSVPWPAVPGMMAPVAGGEFRLTDRPRRLPASFTLIARREG
ncbi:MAG: methyltransferase domain-containing protein [Arachnia sp.]